MTFTRSCKLFIALLVLTFASYADSGADKLKGSVKPAGLDGVYFVDLLELLGKSEEWAPDITKDLEEKGKTWEAEIKKMQQDFEKEAKAFKEKEDMMNESAKQETKDKLLEKSRDIENKAKSRNEDLNRVAQRAQQELNKRLEETIAEMAKKEDWKMIFGRGPGGVLYVLYVDDSLNNTIFIAGGLKEKYAPKKEENKKILNNLKK